MIRNTFCPDTEGSRIEPAPLDSSKMVKFIAVKNDITLREIRRADQAEDLDALIAFCKKQSAAATVLSSSDRALYVAVD